MGYIQPLPNISLKSAPLL